LENRNFFSEKVDIFLDSAAKMQLRNTNKDDNNLLFYWKRPYIKKFNGSGNKKSCSGILTM